MEENVFGSCVCFILLTVHRWPLAVYFRRSDLLKVPDMVTKYSIKITKGTNRIDPIYAEEFTTPGRKTVILPVNPPESALFVISMIDDHGQYFEDTLYISLSTKFYVWLKYIYDTFSCDSHLLHVFCAP